MFFETQKSRKIATVFLNPKNKKQNKATKQNNTHKPTECMPEILETLNNSQTLIACKDENFVQSQYMFENKNENTLQMYEYSNKVTQICKRNLAKLISPHIMNVKDLANLISDFIGYSCSPDKW